ncbi:response regulator transcription factor [Streptomyces sp. NPDC087420]|uniref:response regulator transcription factor n=1 Tax=Streptomyces sp. NPDC087420 TaxID=3365785 RepID=UPI003834E428
MTIRVVLADDQALLLGTFRLLIDSCDDMEVIAVAGDGGEAVAAVRATRPDVIVMDIRMRGLASGFLGKDVGSGTFLDAIRTVAAGDEIAARLCLSPLTVRTHVHRAIAKLDARDRAQLVVIAYRSGLVQP